MKLNWNSLEKIFAIAALVFFTRVLDFESLVVPSEGLAAVTTAVGENPLSPLLSLIQHGTFLVVASLLFLRRERTLATLQRGLTIWFLLGFALFSFIWSDIPDISFRGAFALMESCTFAVYLAANYSFQQQLRLLAWALGITAMISLLYTVVFPAYGIEQGIHQGAWRGPFIQKNIFARLLMLGTLVCLSLQTKNLRAKYAIWGGLGLFLGLTILSQSKTALIAFVLLFIVGLIYKSFRLKDLIAIPLAGSLLLIFSTVSLVVVSQAETILNSIGKDLTFSGRTTIWLSLLEQIKLRPWFGYGYMGFWANDDTQYLMQKLYGTTYVPSHSHNGYLELITSFGAIGAILYVITFMAIARRAVILMRWNRTSEGLWPLLFLSFLLIYNFSEPTAIEHNSIFWIVYLALALTRFIAIEPTVISHQLLVNSQQSTINSC